MAAGKKILLIATVLAAASVTATSAAGRRGLRLLPAELRIVAPLADRALEPGVARCTSDGRCTVTDAEGTRPGTPLLVER